MLVRSFNITYGLNTTTSISSNNFGPNQNNEKFIPKIIECLINSKPIPVYGDGLNIRDWIYVEDHCKAIDIIFFTAPPTCIALIESDSYNLKNLLEKIFCIDLENSEFSDATDITVGIFFINSSA